MRYLLVSAMALGAAACALGGIVDAVVPPAYKDLPGTGTFVGPQAIGPRTYQLLIHESLLTDLVGMSLNGITWRLPVSAASDWPSQDVSYSSYDIYLSGSVAPEFRSLTFANNVVGPQTLVRSGPLTVSAGTYTFGTSPNAFAPTITFNEWLYAGGHLLIEIRHVGNTIASRSVDAVSTSTAGYGTLFSAAWASSATATSGSQGNFAISRLSAVPEPASAMLAGAVLLVTWRRRA